MSPDGIDANAINDILSSLSEEDMENLKSMAQELFSSSPSSEKKNQNSPPPKQNRSTDAGSSFDFSDIAKIASLMNLISGDKNDPRYDLLRALRPMLSKDKQPKVDQAVKMLQLMSILPKIKEMGS